MPLAPRRIALVSALVLVALAGVAVPAAAVDGVVEINQVRALAGGVTPSDTAGFPVTIASSGSYRLSGNLTVPDANTTAIQVTASAVDVTIDLNGFAILGPVTCSGSPTTCAPSSAWGDGILAEGVNHGTLTVSNGVIKGMGSYGVSANRTLLAQALRVSDAGNTGIYGSEGSVIDSTASWTGGYGVVLGVGVVRGCTVHDNRVYGVDIAIGSVIGNTIYSNGLGVEGETDITVLDNSIFDNTSYGLEGSGGYARNVFRGNNSAPPFPGNQISTAIQIGSNICGTALCP